MAHDADDGNTIVLLYLSKLRQMDNLKCSRKKFDYVLETRKALFN